ncbi:alkylphosphocholine resistance protein lem3 [Leucoagaricus gongylophorus]
MGLFSRRKKNDSKSKEKENGAWRKPANTAFKQQRLKAWQPILTPKTVLPTLFLIGFVFAPIGGLLIWGSSLVSEISFDYTQCENLQGSSSNASLNWFPLPSNKYSYRLKAGSDSIVPPSPRYAYIPDTGLSDPSNQRQCIVEFNIPINLQAPVFFYYGLTNFYQNHRRYVKSLNSDQLQGKYVSPNSLNNSDCDPLGAAGLFGNISIYPCGLIANSIFNDTFYTPTLQNSNDSSEPQPYPFSEKGIAWDGERRKYVADPTKTGNGYSSYSEIMPPPNWRLRFPQGYNETNMPNLQEDEHFQNWMRTAGLPSFTKLYGRNDIDTMQSGTYQIVIGLNFPVLSYRGTKSFVISTVSWIGGKNPFLGWAYVASSALFILIAILGTARHLIKPRRLGDMSLLSWNR